MGPFAATASGTPNVKRPSAEDDGTRHVTPPHFYPFHEFDQVADLSKFRVPSSIRYQTEYVNQVGAKLQQILNKQGNK